MNEAMANDPKMSFWQLLSEYKIEIPIIQRDYAQGRKSEKVKEIRKRFLGNLMNALLSDNKCQELDFIYGSIYNENKNTEKTFHPLDGQQRLTTLFLLHWFIALKSNILKDYESTFSKFTYEIRITSRDFCQELVRVGQEESLGKGDTIREKIQDSNWFFLGWEKDPTIEAMLVMLNAIENQLAKKPQSSQEYKKIWEKLVRGENPPITFNFTELGHFSDPDSLYIKMNARGKELTDFEYFKASFTKYITEQKWVTKEISTTFTKKLDNEWTDLFWKHRDSDNSIDQRFIKFIAGVAVNFYAQRHNKQEGKENVERIQKLVNNPNEVSSDDFPSEESFDYLNKVLDVYSDDNFDELVPEKLPLWDFCKSNSTIFKEFINEGEVTYKQRILFYAQTKYLMKTETKKIDKNQYHDWMRVVRNIVQNSRIDEADRYIGAFGLIEELSEGCDSIYTFLSKKEIKSKFASKQIEEEAQKAKLICDSQNDAVRDTVKKTLFEIEDLNFFKGKIEFALYCYTKTPDLKDIHIEDFDTFTNKLKSIGKVVKKHLDGDDVSNTFRRALLTLGKNDFYEYWSTWSYSTNSLKRRMIENVSELQSYFRDDDSKDGKFRNYLEELLNKLASKFDSGLDGGLDLIIQEYSFPEGIKNWKKRLIQEPKLLDNHCQSHCFSIPEDESYCYLFNEWKRPRRETDCEKIS